MDFRQGSNKEKKNSPCLLWGEPIGRRGGKKKAATKKKTRKSSLSAVGEPTGRRGGNKAARERHGARRREVTWGIKISSSESENGNKKKGE